MLALARSYQSAVGDSIGWHNTAFQKGRIQDLALDLDALDAWLRDHPVLDSAGLQAMEAEMSRQREKEPADPERFGGRRGLELRLEPRRGR